MEEKKNPMIISTEEMKRLADKYMLGLCGDETIEEKIATIKSELGEDFTAFYGEQHKQLISERINGVNLAFVYQMIGDCNSVENMLEKRQRILFKEEIGVDILSLGTIAMALMEDMPIIEMAKKLPNCFQEVVESLSFSMMKLMIDKNEIARFKSEVLEKYALWDNKYFKIFSKDPEENRELVQLKIYIENYKQQLSEDIKKKLGNWLRTKNPESLELDDEDFFEEVRGYALVEDFIRDEDPIFSNFKNKYPTIDLSGFVNKGSLVAGFVHVDEECRRNIMLGTSFDDHAIIHEVNHVIDNGGFDQISVYLREGSSDPNEMFRRYEIINEAVNDKFACMIGEYREKIGRKKFFNKPSIPYLYQDTFDYVDDWFTDYLPELKESRFKNNPVNEFSKYVGRDAFEVKASIVTAVMENIYKENSMTRDDGYLHQDGE